MMWFWLLGWGAHSRKALNLKLRRCGDEINRGGFRQPERCALLRRGKESQGKVAGSDHGARQKAGEWFWVLWPCSIQVGGLEKRSILAQAFQGGLGLPPSKEGHSGTFGGSRPGDPADHGRRTPNRKTSYKRKKNSGQTLGDRKTLLLCLVVDSVRSSSPAFEGRLAFDSQARSRCSAVGGRGLFWDGNPNGASNGCVAPQKGGLIMDQKWKITIWLDWLTSLTIVFRQERPEV